MEKMTKKQANFRQNADDEKTISQMMDAKPVR
jgi:hypothetical protein